MKAHLTRTSLIALAIGAMPQALAQASQEQSAAPVGGPQTTNPPMPAPTSIGALGAPALEEANTPPPAPEGIAEIVVTAQRRSENLQRAALAVSAVDAAAIRNASVSQPQDLTKLVPALQLAPLGGGGTQVTIRGVGNFAPFIYSDPAVAINYDGVYLARSAAPNGLFFDLDRVEVLKGPQGTLYGRNATGGAVNVITAKPTLDGVHAAGDAEGGNYGLYRGSAMINVPLGDTVALRIAGQAIHRNGYLSDGYLDDKGQAIRGQLLYKPDEKLRINLEADYIHEGGKGAGGVLVPDSGYLYPGHPYRGATSAASQAILTGASLGITGGTNPDFLPKFGTDGRTDIKAYGFAATIDYDFGSATLTFLPAYRHTENDDFKHYVGGFPLVSTERSNQESAELRLASNGGGPLKWVVGGYYFHDDSDLYVNTDQGIAALTTIATSLPVRSLAAFGQATYSVTSRFRVTAGARYTNERKSQAGENIAALPAVPTGFAAPAPVFYNIVCPAPAASVDLAALTCTGPFTGRVKYNRVTWKAGVEFDVAPQSLLYASAETGFKAGGFYPSLAPNTYKPERIFAITAGSKNRFLDNKVQLNLEAFYWKYKDKQVSHLGAVRPEGYSIITENAGAATIYGAEGDFIWKPTRVDRLNVNLQYVHSRYNQFDYTVPLLSASIPQAAVACPQTVTSDAQGNRTSAVDCAGKVLAQTPKWTLNASYQHTVPIGRSNLDAIVGTRVESSFYVGEEFLSGEYQRRSMVSYASLTYRFPEDRFSIGAYIDNIEDRAVKASSFVQPAVGIPVVVLRPPRTYGVRAGFRF